MRRPAFEKRETGEIGSLTHSAASCRHKNTVRDANKQRGEKRAGVEGKKRHHTPISPTNSGGIRQIDKRHWNYLVSKPTGDTNFDIGDQLQYSRTRKKTSLSDIFFLALGGDTPAGALLKAELHSLSLAGFCPPLPRLHPSDHPRTRNTLAARQAFLVSAEQHKTLDGNFCFSHYITAQHGTHVRH